MVGRGAAPTNRRASATPDRTAPGAGAADAGVRTNTSTGPLSVMRSVAPPPEVNRTEGSAWPAFGTNADGAAESDSMDRGEGAESASHALEVRGSNGFTRSGSDARTNGLRAAEHPSVAGM